MEKEYAQAVFDLAQKPGADASALVRKLVEHLRETGREKLLPRIARELHRLDARAETFGQNLEVATESERSGAEKEAGEIGIKAKAVINDSLVSGWRARTGSRIIDRSGKRALIELYRRIALNA